MPSKFNGRWRHSRSEDRIKPTRENLETRKLPLSVASRFFSGNFSFIFRLATMTTVDCNGIEKDDFAYTNFWSFFSRNSKWCEFSHSTSVSRHEMEEEREIVHKKWNECQFDGIRRKWKWQMATESKEQLQNGTEKEERQNHFEMFVHFIFVCRFERTPKRILRSPIKRNEKDDDCRHDVMSLLNQATTSFCSVSFHASFMEQPTDDQLSNWVFHRLVVSFPLLAITEIVWYIWLCCLPPSSPLIFGVRHWSNYTNDAGKFSFSNETKFSSFYFR